MPRCNVGLGSTSSRWAKEQAIEKHRKACHPRVTRKELYHKRWKQWKSPKQIYLQQSRMKLSMTRRANKFAAKDMSPLGHSLLHFLPDWASWKYKKGGTRKYDLFTCVKCLQVRQHEWKKPCRGTGQGIASAQRGFWSNLSEVNQSRLLDIWGLKKKEADVIFAPPHDEISDFGHDLVRFTPKAGVWPVAGADKRQITKYTICTKCWRVNPSGSASVWKIQCDHDSEHAGRGRVRSWKAMKTAQKRVLCKLWGVSIAEADEWLCCSSRNAKS